MLPHPDIWRTFRPGLRIFLWLSFSCLLAALWYAYFLLGPRQVKEEEAVQTQQQMVTLNVQWQQLWLRKSALSRYNEEVKTPAPPFSALHFQSSEASLVSWLPDEKGGELVLEMRWLRLPVLFKQLAEREMMPTAFTIQPEEGRQLRFTLHLETFREH